VSHLFQDPIFFYAIAYALFLLAVWFLGRKPVLSWVDGEIEKIRQELDQARRLRVEAETLLAEARAKNAAALAGAEAIIAHAKEEAVQFEVAARNDLQFLLAKHEQQALARIRYLEEEAIAQVQVAIVDAAMELVRKTLTQHVDEAALTKMTDQAIADMPNLAPAKAKAA